MQIYKFSSINKILKIRPVGIQVDKNLCWYCEGSVHQLTHQTVTSGLIFSRVHLYWMGTCHCLTDLGEVRPPAPPFAPNPTLGRQLNFSSSWSEKITVWFKFILTHSFTVLSWLKLITVSVVFLYKFSIQLVLLAGVFSNPDVGGGLLARIFFPDVISSP